MSTQIHPDKRKKTAAKTKKKSFHQRRIFTGIIPGQRQKHSELGALGAGSAPLMCVVVEGDCSGNQSTCDAAAAGKVTCHTFLNNFLKNRTGKHKHRKVFLESCPSGRNVWARRVKYVLLTPPPPRLMTVATVAAQQPISPHLRSDNKGCCRLCVVSDTQEGGGVTSVCDSPEVVMTHRRKKKTSSTFCKAAWVTGRRVKKKKERNTEQGEYGSNGWAHYSSPNLRHLFSTNLPNQLHKYW